MRGGIDLLELLSNATADVSAATALQQDEGGGAKALTDFVNAVRRKMDDKQRQLDELLEQRQLESAEAREVAKLRLKIRRLQRDLAKAQGPEVVAAVEAVPVLQAQIRDLEKALAATKTELSEDRVAKVSELENLRVAAAEAIERHRAVSEAASILAAELDVEKLSRQAAESQAAAAAKQAFEARQTVTTELATVQANFVEQEVEKQAACRVQSAVDRALDAAEAVHTARVQQVLESEANSRQMLEAEIQQQAVAATNERTARQIVMAKAAALVSEVGEAAAAVRMATDESLKAAAAVVVDCEAMKAAEERAAQTSEVGQAEANEREREAERRLQFHKDMHAQAMVTLETEVAECRADAAAARLAAHDVAEAEKAATAAQVAAEIRAAQMEADAELVQNRLHEQKLDFQRAQAEIQAAHEERELLCEKLNALMIERDCAESQAAAAELRARSFADRADVAIVQVTELTAALQSCEQRLATVTATASSGDAATESADDTRTSSSTTDSVSAAVADGRIPSTTQLQLPPLLQPPAAHLQQVPPPLPVRQDPPPLGCETTDGENSKAPSPPLALEDEEDQQRKLVHPIGHCMETGTGASNDEHQLVATQSDRSSPSELWMSAAAFGYDTATPHPCTESDAEEDDTLSAVCDNQNHKKESLGLELPRLRLENAELRVAMAKLGEQQKEMRNGFEQQIVRLTTMLADIHMTDETQRNQRSPQSSSRGGTRTPTSPALGSSTDGLDRAVVADLLVKHLCRTTPPAARTQALSVLAGMLELNADERISVGLTSQWELEKPELVKQVSEGRNQDTFADMWAKYLQGS